MGLGVWERADDISSSLTFVFVLCVPSKCISETMKLVQENMLLKWNGRENISPSSYIKEEPVVLALTEAAWLS